MITKYLIFSRAILLIFSSLVLLKEKDRGRFKERMFESVCVLLLFEFVVLQYISIIFNWIVEIIPRVITRAIAKMFNM